MDSSFYIYNGLVATTATYTLNLHAKHNKLLDAQQEQDARVRIRPIARRGLVGILQPFGELK